MQPVESCCVANFYATFKKHYFFIKIALKLSYFYKKMENFQALGAPPQDPRAFDGWGLRPFPIFNFWLCACRCVFSAYLTSFQIVIVVAENEQI